MDAGADGSVGLGWVEPPDAAWPVRLVGLTVNLRDTGAGPHRGGTTPTRMHFGCTGLRKTSDAYRFR